MRSPSWKVTNHDTRSPQVMRVEEKEKPAEAYPNGISTEGFGRGRSKEKQRTRKMTREDSCYRSKTRRTMGGGDGIGLNQLTVHQTIKILIPK